MPTLKELDRAAQVDVPVEMGRALKALAADERHAVAWRYLLDEICGWRRYSFVPGVPEARDLMIWREGRRFVGELLMRIVETPIPDMEEPAPKPRTMSERQRRRAKPAEG